MRDHLAKPRNLLREDVWWSQVGEGRTRSRGEACRGSQSVASEQALQPPLLQDCSISHGFSDLALAKAKRLCDGEYMEVVGLGGKSVEVSWES